MKPAYEVIPNIPTLKLFHELDIGNIRNFTFMCENHDLMKHIGWGTRWNKYYVQKMIDYSMDITAKEPNIRKRPLIHWAIMLNGEIIGYAGLKSPMIKNYHDFQLRLFIDPKYQQHGFGTHILKLISTMPELLRLKIWLFSNNPDAIKLFKKLFKKGDDVELHHNIYRSFYFIVGED